MSRQKNHERDDAIRAARAAGEAVADIAARFGLTYSRIVQISNPKSTRQAQRRAVKKKAWRQANGVCRECESTALEGRAYCEHHQRQYDERRAKWRDEGRCLRCGTTDKAVIEAGNERMCANCQASIRSWHERNAERIAERKIERMIEGVCPNCGRPLAFNRASCEACLEASRRYSQKKRRELRQKRLLAGLCTSCGTRPPRAGIATCETCLARRRTQKRKHAAMRRNEHQQARLAAEAKEAERRRIDEEYEATMKNWKPIEPAVKPVGPRSWPRPVTCLSCNKQFQAHGPGNRMCDRCRHGADGDAIHLGG